MTNKIKAEIITHSKRENTGEEIITYKLTFPRIILSEVNTYKMLEKNTSSCLDGDTPIMLYNKKDKYLFERPIRFIYQDFINDEIDYGIISYDEDKNIFFLNEIKTVFSTGVKEVFGLGNKYLNYLECTKEHKLLTNDGWITTEQFIQNYKDKNYQHLYKIYESFKILNVNSENNYVQWRDSTGMCANKEIVYILNITNEGKRETYDIEVGGDYHNFLANKIIVHNSRAIPFEKMVEVVEKEPFIPIAWQLKHKGMQGTKYITDPYIIESKKVKWLSARNRAINSAIELSNEEVSSVHYRNDENGVPIEIHKTYIENSSVSKQIANRLLEPFMWTTQLITGTRESFKHLFEQRCPIYDISNEILRLAGSDTETSFKSKKETIKRFPQLSEKDDLWWLQHNKGQAEIHFMDLAEKMYDALNESTPKKLYSEEWHIPFREEILKDKESKGIEDLVDLIKMSVCLTAKISYTKIGDENIITIEKAREMYEKLKNSGHWSCFGHIAKCMTDKEYKSWYKGFIDTKEYVNSFGEVSNGLNCDDFVNAQGYNKNLKGFISLRQYVEDSVELKDI